MYPVATPLVSHPPLILEPMLRTESLRKTYRTGDIETVALGGVTLRIEAGEFVSIMGPSGCGKSTLLNLVGLLDTPSGGALFFQGRDLANVSERERAQARKGGIGFVFQSFNLIDELTVRENVELPLLYLKMNAAERKRRVEAALERVGMAHRRAHTPQQLSGGQQQRVAIARAVVAEPPLILADEPTGNLDSAHGEEVMRLLADLNEAGTTVAMVTHSAADADYSHRVVHLFDGQIVSENMVRQASRAPVAA